MLLKQVIKNLETVSKEIDDMMRREREEQTVFLEERTSNGAAILLLGALLVRIRAMFAAVMLAALKDGVDVEALAAFVEECAMYWTQKWGTDEEDIPRV